MARAVILGAGMVGSEMARDLAEDSALSVRVVDRDAAGLERLAARLPQVEVVAADVTDPTALTRLVDDADVVLGALSSRIAHKALEVVVRAGKRMVDIAFMAEDGRTWHDLARRHGAIAVIDCGVAPGVSNLVAAHAVASMDRCDRLDIFVGGLPVTRRWPFHYKAAFAPEDVLEEYVRPARLVEHGRQVVRPALSEPERVDFEGIGSLEAFNTDGLRSLADTLRVPFLREKTLRYPGHRELMEVFRATGLFSEVPIEVDGCSVIPRRVLAKVMFPHWKYGAGEEDLTLLRLTAEGDRQGRRCRMTFDLMDRFDRATGSTSMARTTAFPCTEMARLLLTGVVTEPGVHPPERFGARRDVLDAVLGAMRRRGVRWTLTES